MTLKTNLRDEINAAKSYAVPPGSRFLHSFLVLCVSLFIPWYYSPIDPKPYTFPSPLPRLEGPLAVNNYLQNATRLFEHEIIGPESFAVDETGTLFTGCGDGQIMAVSSSMSLTVVARTGLDDPMCGSYELEPMCGRPKGMKFGPMGYLYVVDSYKGLLRVNVTTGAVETLVSNEKGADGVPFRFLNGLDIDSDGVIYFTDSSSKWDRRNFRYEVLETHQAGRLLKYDVTKGEITTLLDDLYLANGVAVSRDESFLVVSEMSVARLRRYYLKGPRAGSSDVFVDNLPGFPDNIKLNSRNNFYIGLGSVRFHGSSPIGSFLDILGPRPGLKKIIVAITPFALYNMFMPKHALVVEVTPTGTIVDSLHDPGAKVLGAVSEVFETREKLFVGHFQSPYLGMIQLEGHPQRIDKG